MLYPELDPRREKDIGGKNGKIGLMAVVYLIVFERPGVTASS